MNRIEEKFKTLKRQNKKAFVAFVTAGDPDLATTAKLIPALEEAGVDILELGVPFSDPMADGPVIQRSSERALKSGTSLIKILNLVKNSRKTSVLPILLMGYLNPILAYGVDKFFRDAKASGVDGTLIVDLPPEEGEAVRQAAKKHGVSLVYLLTPTSDAKRIALVSRKGSGFIYYVSLTGVTGAALKNQALRQGPLKKVLQKSKLPVCVGFGIKNAAQAKSVATQADGVVVGSALVNLLEKKGKSAGVKALQAEAKRLATAVHGV